MNAKAATVTPDTTNDPIISCRCKMVRITLKNKKQSQKEITQCSSQRNHATVCLPSLTPLLIMNNSAASRLPPTLVSRSCSNAEIIPHSPYQTRLGAAQPLKFCAAHARTGRWMRNNPSSSPPPALRVNAVGPVTVADDGLQRTHTGTFLLMRYSYKTD